MAPTFCNYSGPVRPVLQFETHTCGDVQQRLSLRPVLLQKAAGLQHELHEFGPLSFSWGFQQILNIDLPGPQLGDSVGRGKDSLA